jgi:hypothetical protein
VGAAVSLGASPDGSPVEEEERQYTGVQLRAARPEEPWYVLERTRRIITRAGQTYTTDYEYSTSVSPHFHEYHRPTTITEREPRLLLCCQRNRRCEVPA